MIESEIFKAGRGRFAWLLFERHGSGWLLVGILLIFLSLFLGLVLDYRIILLALIVVCLVSPAMVLILYFNYGMKGMNFINVIDHKIEIDRDGVRIILYGKNEEKNEDERMDDEQQEDLLQELRTYDFPFNRLGKLNVGSDYVVFAFRPSIDGFLYIPQTAFRDNDEFYNAVKVLQRSVGIKLEN